MAEIVELNGEWFVSFINIKGSDFECIGIKDGDMHGPFKSEKEASEYIKGIMEDI